MLCVQQRHKSIRSPIADVFLDVALAITLVCLRLEKQYLPDSFCFSHLRFYFISFVRAVVTVIFDECSFWNCHTLFIANTAESLVVLSTAGVCVDAAQLSVVTCVVTDAACLTRNTSPRKLHVLSSPAVDTSRLQLLYKSCTCITNAFSLRCIIIVSPFVHLRCV